MRRFWGAGTNPTPWRSCSGARTEDTEDGFSLIELIIVAMILPVVVGAISFALISIFSLQGGTSSRISASGDAQVVSSNFESDVQGSSYITTSSTATGGPAPCESTAQISNADVVVLSLQSNTANQVALGLLSGNGQTEVTYLEVPSGTVSPITYKLIRNICQGGATTPVGTSTVSYAVPSPSGNTVSITCDAALVTALPSGTAITSLVVAPLTTAVANGDKIKVGTGTTAVTFTTNTSSLIPAATSVAAGASSIPVTSQTLATSVPAGTTAVDQSWPVNCGASSSWISTASVTGVAFATTGTGSSPYAYNLTAVPRPGSTSVQPTNVASPNSSCVFATGSGTYTSSLCFVDLSAWNSYSGTSSASCPGAGLAMSAGINRTADILSFCLNVQSVVTSGGAAVSGAISGGGYNGVKAVAFPTYGGAFLGNNGFYTVASTQFPALYQQNTNVGKTTTVTITKIQVSDPSGNAATGWELVTGDAETTDTGESMTWQSDQALTLLNNTPASPVGNACESAPPTTNSTYLTGLGTTKVVCSATDSSNKNGTVMLEAPHPAGLTVTMVGTGLEGMFLGVMLPYTSS
jgi:prepilin-type N-terminal cleavage/methylation domain-containing protein